MSLAPLLPSSSCRKRSPCIAGRGRCSSVWAWGWCRSRKSRAHKAEGNDETLESVKQDIAPSRKVPAAKIQFLPEDRVWIAERIQEVLSTGQLTLGQYGAEFEQKFAQFCGTRHALAASSGTRSLEIILRALRAEGKAILVPTNT